MSGTPGSSEGFNLESLDSIEVREPEGRVFHLLEFDPDVRELDKRSNTGIVVQWLRRPKDSMFFVILTDEKKGERDVMEFTEFKDARGAFDYPYRYVGASRAQKREQLAKKTEEGIRAPLIDVVNVENLGNQPQ